MSSRKELVWKLMKLKMPEEFIIAICATILKTDETMCQELLDWIKVYPNPSEQDLLVMSLEISGALDDEEEADNEEETENCVNGRTKQA